MYFYTLFCTTLILIFTKMNRRDALARVAWMMGGALSAPTAMAFLEGCKSATESGGVGFSFASEQLNLVSEIAELIIPKTDTPGAKDAGVGPFIEKMLKDCYTEVQQKHFIAGLEALEKEADKAGGAFTSLTAEKQTTVLKAMEAAAKQEAEANQEKAKAKEVDTESGLEKKDAKKEEIPTPFFTLMKELTLFGYFTSEVGCKEALAFEPIPGRYEGCTTLQPGQKAWAL